MHTKFVSTIGKINIQIFSLYLKRVVNIAILEVGPISNECPGNFTLYTELVSQNDTLTVIKECHLG